MFETITNFINFFKLGQPDNFEVKYNSIVSTPYYRRFFTSWILWNWKSILSILLSKQELFFDEPLGYRTKLDFIASFYNPWYLGICYLYIFPAFTAWILYYPLEYLGVLSYKIIKWSWKKRVFIENNTNSTTQATNGMISEYAEGVNKSRIELTQKTIELIRKESEHNSNLKKLNIEIEELNKENAKFKIELFDKNQDISETDKLKNDARTVLKIIYNSPEKEQLLDELEKTGKKIRRENNKYENLNVNEYFKALELNKVFTKLENSDLYSITTLGEYVFALKILEKQE